MRPCIKLQMMCSPTNNLEHTPNQLQRERYDALESIAYNVAALSEPGERFFWREQMSNPTSLPGKLSLSTWRSYK